MTEQGDSCDGLLASAVLEGTGEHPMAIRVGWSRPVAEGRAVVIWVDGELAAWTDGVGDRGVWVLMDRTVTHRLDGREVSREALVEGRLKAPSHRGLKLTRDTDLAVDAWLLVEGDREVLQQRVWPGGSARGGFGTRFGEGAFGLDGGGSPGLGLGELGEGELGLDGASIDLATGVMRQLGGFVEVSAATNVGGRGEPSVMTADALPEGLSMRGLSWLGQMLRIETRDEVCR